MNEKKIHQNLSLDSCAHKQLTEACRIYTISNFCLIFNSSILVSKTRNQKKPKIKKRTNTWIKFEARINYTCMKWMTKNNSKKIIYTKCMHVAYVQNLMCYALRPVYYMYKYVKCWISSLASRKKSIHVINVCVCVCVCRFYLFILFSILFSCF